MGIQQSTMPWRIRRAERRREPKIGHLKSDHRMNRCFLAGLHGDATNAVLAAAGANMRKLLRRLFNALIRWLEGAFVLPMPITSPCHALSENLARDRCPLQVDDLPVIAMPDGLWRLFQGRLASSRGPCVPVM